MTTGTSELKALNRQLGLASGTRAGAVFVFASHFRALCCGRLVAVPHAALASLGRRRASSARHRACRRLLLLGAGAEPRRVPGRWDWEHRDRRRGLNRCTQSRADAAGLCLNVGRMERELRVAAREKAAARLGSHLAYTCAATGLNPGYIYTETGRAPPTAAPQRVPPVHICARTGLTLPTAHLHRDRP
jgi:hypothetical protein